MTEPRKENTNLEGVSEKPQSQSTTDAESDITGPPENAGTQSTELSYKISEDLTIDLSKEKDIKKIFEYIKTGKIDFAKFLKDAFPHIKQNHHP